MLTQGVVKESSSPWECPIVLVSKPDGTTKFCVDYRWLNSMTKVDEFPLPRVFGSPIGPHLFQYIGSFQWILAGGHCRRIPREDCVCDTQRSI